VRDQVEADSAKHAALESLRKHLTGDVDADLTPEQKRDRLNYLLQKAGYVRPNTETKQEQVD
jgi:Spy/CpxP family protein refolding chaperone